MLEADRIQRRRVKDLDLYYKDHLDNFTKLAEAYEPEVEEMVSNVFKKRRMQYVITFVDAIDVQDKLMPSANRILRYFTMEMNYGNVVKNIGIRDINYALGLSMNYAVKAIKQLCEKDIIRFTQEKGRRTYMVNPTYFYKGTLRRIFKCTRDYDKLPRRNGDLEIQYEQN